MLKFENEEAFNKFLEGSPMARRKNFQRYKLSVAENEIDDRIRELLKSDFDHKIKLDETKYAAISPTKSIDGRAFTYAVVWLETLKVEHSYCQFVDYSDLLIELALHNKLNVENESVSQAVSLIIGGASRMINNK